MAKLDIVNANNVIESNPQRAYFKLKNTGGPKGDKGDTGERGPQGATGPQGPAGLSASVRVGSTTTLNPGADATVTNSGDSHNAVLDFGIPTGAQGPKGDTGSQGPRGPQGFQGPKGDTGAAATVQVGNTNTGAPGTNAQVTNVGTQYNAKLNFTIPRGDKGETGSQGPQGPKGADGVDGYSPSATVTQEGLNAEIEITDKDGTTTATVPGFGVQVVDSLPATGSENVIYLERDSTTVSGNPITITDAVAAPLVGYEIIGNTTQNTLTGKNLLPATYGSETINDVVFTKNSDGSVTANGTASAGINYYTNGYTYTELQAGTYTLSDGVSSGESNDTFFTFLDGGPSYNSTVNNPTFTLSQATNLRTRIVIRSGVRLDNVVFKVQLESGSTATSYEPYCGGVPSPNPSYPQTVNTVTGEQTIAINETSYEVNLGKNLFNKDKTKDDYYYNNSGTTTSDGTNKFVNQEFTGITKMAISWSSRNGASAYVRVCEYKADGTFIKRTLVSTNNTILTMGANTWKVITSVDAGPVFSFTDLQIERGDSVTDYAAYFEPIELCKIGDYQDYIYKDGSDWKIHKAVGKYVFSDMTQFTYTSDKTRLYITKDNLTTLGVDFILPANQQTSLLAMADRFTATSFDILYNSESGSFLASSSTGNWSFRKVGWSGADEAKSELTGTTVYYALATATDTTITNSALIAQLEAILAGGTKAGTNNIVLTPAAGATGSLAVGYYNAYASYLYVNGQWQKFAMLTGAN